MPISITEDVSDVFILSASSDIGEQLALDYLRRGVRVAGTFRTELPASLCGQAGFEALRCDLASQDSGLEIAEFLRVRKLRWNIFISCVGQLAPIGPFFECDFAAWAQSVETNCIAQLRALHAVHSFRRIGAMNHVVFFAGGGTNNPFRSYSAYCLGKIALIKMCELLDSENPDLNAFIVGTGWVNTKIHRQTLAAGTRAGTKLGKTLDFTEQSTQGTTHEEIAAMICWGVEQGRAVVGGRNFSIVHDPWGGGGAPLAAALRADADKFKLRRHGN